jgi:hypothetical protein
MKLNENRKVNIREGGMRLEITNPKRKFKFAVQGIASRIGEKERAELRKSLGIGTVIN